MSKKYDAEAFAIQVQKGTFSGCDCFEATVREFPDIAEYADTADVARALVIDAITTTISYLVEKGLNVPSPIIRQSEFSGRITLRVPPDLHRFCAERAIEDGVSLNQFVVTALTFVRGMQLATALGPAWSPTELPVQGESFKASKVRLQQQIPVRVPVPKELWN